jgi:hypothetical protein
MTCDEPSLQIGLPYRRHVHIGVMSTDMVQLSFIVMSEQASWCIDLPVRYPYIGRVDLSLRNVTKIT